MHIRTPKIIRKYSLEIFFCFTILVVWAWPYLVLRVVGGPFKLEPVSVAFILIICLLVFVRPSVLPVLSPKGMPGIIFRDRAYFENYDNRISTFVRAVRKLTFLWIIVAFAVWSDFQTQKEIKLKECLVRKFSVEEPAPSYCANLRYHEKHYFHDNETLIVGLIFSLTTILLTAYWNIDSTYGRKWSYICGIYKDFISIDGTNPRKKEIFRINLCIDILDHSFWNTKQFKVFIRGELEKYYYFAVNNQDFMNWIISNKTIRSRDFACLQNFLQEFYRHHVQAALDTQQHLNQQIELGFDEVRTSLTVLYEFFEYLDSQPARYGPPIVYPDLDKYEPLAASTAPKWNLVAPFI